MTQQKEIRRGSSMDLAESIEKREGDIRSRIFVHKCDRAVC